MRAILTRAVSLVFVGAALVGSSDAGVAQQSDRTIEAWPQREFLKDNRKVPGVVETGSGLQFMVITAGTGPHPTDRDVALINYRGTLLSGAIFDASTKPTPLSVDRAIRGVSQALKLMNKGAKYRFWIPPQLGFGRFAKYDKAENVLVPGNAVLVLDIELLEFMPHALVDEYNSQLNENPVH